MPARPADEEILAAVEALQGGAGTGAFEIVYRRFRLSILQFFLNRHELREDAEDLAQVTFFRAYSKIRQFRFQAPFEVWLRGIAENVWRNAVRDRRAAKRGPAVEPLEAAEAGQEQERTPPLVVRDVFGREAATPEQLALRQERTRVLERAIAELPAGMRRCAELRLFADLQYKEISAVTGIGPNSVRSQLFEARQRLKPVLDRYFQGADF